MKAVALAGTSLGCMRLVMLPLSGHVQLWGLQVRARGMLLNAA